MSHILFLLFGVVIGVAWTERANRGRRARFLAAARAIQEHQAMTAITISMQRQKLREAFEAAFERGEKPTREQFN